MNKETQKLLEQHFDTAFDTPDGIKKLRELILTLAMQGRLVPQDPNDQPASELLKEIAAEKARLIKEGRLKPQKPLPPIDPKEIPYELPASWQWMKLGQICDINGGYAFKSSNYTDDGIRVVRISDFDENGFKNDKIVRYSFSPDLVNYMLEPDCVLMAMTGGTVGKSFLVKSLSEQMLVNQRVAKIKPFSRILPEFTHYIIRAPLIQSKIELAKKSTNDNISRAHFRISFPLPPFSEQKRIVARVEQLMARCDDLRSAGGRRRRKTARTHAAALNAVFAAADSDDFSTA
jgi:type I restriction enzyme S subunit